MPNKEQQEQRESISAVPNHQQQQAPQLLPSPMHGRCLNSDTKLESNQTIVFDDGTLIEPSDNDTPIVPSDSGLDEQKNIPGLPPGRQTRARNIQLPLCLRQETQVNAC